MSVMKRLVFLLVLFCLFHSAAAASQLYRIRLGHYPDKIRAVLDFSAPFTYAAEKQDNKITLILKKTEAGPDIQSYIDANDLVVRYLEIEKTGEDLKITIPLTAPIKYDLFSLNNPPRLVIDFSRDFLQIVSGGLLSDGVELLKLSRGTADGRLSATVLKIDLNKAGVEPVLAKQYKPNILESFISFLTLSGRPRRAERHFFLDSVQSMVADKYALAGVNGTFFASNGKPLGALLINGELITFSIFDRTAFFIDDLHRPYIDNISIYGDFLVKERVRYDITGVNEARSGNDIVMYTPVWGERTGTNDKGFEIIVAKGRVIGTAVHNASIPDDGYVLSAAGPMVESLSGQVKSGDKLEANLKIVPFTTAPRKILHLVAGGPRLVKNGLSYVSKHEEKFRADVAARRAARTAVGIAKSGELLLVTVAPPAKNHQKSGGSIGATLEELAGLMLSLNAAEAMNLDGGGSTAMVVDGKTECGGQRPVSNALIVYPKI